MPKNIIICCDGTNNKFGANKSNVVHLYDVLDNQTDEQIAYYDPGVGTLADSGLWGPIKKKMSVLLGNAFGRGMQRNVEEAYSFLMEKYEEGDKIYLFGFSRGAYTVRVLAGFIHMVGLLEKGNQNLIPYAYEIYSSRKKDRFKIGAQFKYTYSRKFKNEDSNSKKKFRQEIKIHFMGLWDTVSSVGWIGNLHTYAYTVNIKNVKTIRHAMAIDERRTYFMHEKLSYNLEEVDKMATDEEINEKDTKGKKVDIKEVWFAGVHSDVGGSYPALESGLSKIALDWMIKEAAAAGVHFEEWRYNYVVKAEKNGKARKNESPPDHKADRHESLTGFWKIMEAIPRTIVLEYKPKKITKTFIPWGRRRIIPENSILHRSVLDRQRDLSYNPSNLPKSFAVEEYEKVKFQKDD